MHLLAIIIAHDVLQLCHECEICAEDHAYPGIPNIHHADAHGPGFKYGADIGEIDSHPHLIVIDYYSFTVFECPLPSLAMSSVITAFKTIFSDTGIPLTLVMDNALCFTSEEFSEFTKDWNFIHVTSSPRYPRGNAHSEKAVGMVKQIYNCCKDPLLGILVLKTVPLLDVKESPDKIFFGWSLHTNLPKPSMVHTGYEDRYINKEATGELPNTRNFAVQDPVWIKISENVPWQKGTIVSVHNHQSYDVQVDGKVYHRNTHHLTRRYPRVDENPIENNEEDSHVRDEPQRNLRQRQRVKMPRIHHKPWCRLTFCINNQLVI